MRSPLKGMVWIRIHNENTLYGHSARAGKRASEPVYVIRHKQRGKTATCIMVAVGLYMWKRVIEKRLQIVFTTTVSPTSRVSPNNPIHVIPLREELSSWLHMKDVL